MFNRYQGPEKSVRSLQDDTYVNELMERAGTSVHPDAELFSVTQFERRGISDQRKPLRLRRKKVSFTPLSL